ncbi:hypothetical protein J2853_001880 [Streptosporangium lutulentum]|uniref:Uncharacterized protein n=1 Tax=Streptosporangium lutulentum TaxID=1461250 RepID=A0ABT9Q7F0_9ACTN|nr:hypothetical protein [Streptosporangium lutulentum]
MVPNSSAFPDSSITNWCPNPSTNGAASRWHSQTLDTLSADGIGQVGERTVRQRYCGRVRQQRGSRLEHRILVDCRLAGSLHSAHLWSAQTHHNRQRHGGNDSLTYGRNQGTCCSRPPRGDPVSSFLGVALFVLPGVPVSVFQMLQVCPPFFGGSRDSDPSPSVAIFVRNPAVDIDGRISVVRWIKDDAGYHLIDDRSGDSGVGDDRSSANSGGAWPAGGLRGTLR